MPQDLVFEYRYTARQVFRPFFAAGGKIKFSWIENLLSTRSEALTFQDTYCNAVP